MKKPKRKKDAPRKATAIDAYIGDRMRERRQLLRMAQADLAEALGISKQQVQKYEIGQNRVSAARFFGICRVLKISLISMEGEVERGLRGAYFTIEDDGRPAIVEVGRASCNRRGNRRLCSRCGGSEAERGRDSYNLSR
jgi:transcriptional regulator with XRE-family HTH domain